MKGERGRERQQRSGGRGGEGGGGLQSRLTGHTAASFYPDRRTDRKLLDRHTDNRGHFFNCPFVDCLIIPNELELSLHF